MAVSDASRFGCWKTMPTWSRRSRVRSAGRSRVTSRPATDTVPDAGWMSVAATASRLDLPDPDGPTTAVNSPGPTVMLTWSSAVSVRSPSG